MVTARTEHHGARRDQQGRVPKRHVQAPPPLPTPSTVAQAAVIFFSLALAAGLFAFVRGDPDGGPALHGAFLITAFAFLGSLVTLMNQKAHDSLRQRRTDDTLGDLFSGDRHRLR